MDGWKVKWSARPNFPKGRMAEKITRQRDGRVESRHKKKLTKGWRIKWLTRK